MKSIYIKLFTILALVILWQPGNGQRKMEKLGRGVVAVRTTGSQVFVSWRILGTEFNNGTTYNLYRGSTLVASNLSVSNFTDNVSTNATYSVSANINGVEQALSPAESVKTVPYLSIPLKAAGDCYVHLAWVGDLDGDGEFDYIVDRIPNVANLTPKVEAYNRNGTFLWRIDMGPLSLNMDNIEGGAAAISNGMSDGVTVFDLDNDGKAEVALKTAKGTIFADNTVVTHTDEVGNFISIVNGATGTELARKQLPTDYLADGPLGTQFNIAYLDGINPSVVVKAKNRIGDGGFNSMMVAYDYSNGQLTQRWKFKPTTNCPEYHQQRIADVDLDGKDEIVDGGYCVDDNGTLLYSLGAKGIVHGDRFHIGDFDPSREGLEGYGIQQDNPSGLAWYYYDAKNGNILQSQYLANIGDYARGNVADLDPRYPGFEMWTFTDGIYNVSGSKTSTAIPGSYPNFRLWWDGDLQSEMLDGVKFSKWNYASSAESRIFTASDYGAAYTWRNAPVLYGDIFGDWREEVVYESSDHSKLMVFTTTTPTTQRIYTLAHNPEYRLCMATKGYYQSAQTDFYLGAGMATPPIPAMQSAKSTWKGGLAGNAWDTSTSNWTVNNADGSFAQNDDVMFDISGSANTTVNLAEAVSPSSIKVIAPLNYTFAGTGKITGTTGLLKAGSGSLSINTDCDYTDSTRVEQGTLYVNANLSQSPVRVYWGATIGGTGIIAKKAELYKGAVVAPGIKNATGTLTFSSGLALPTQSSCQLDITNDSTGLVKPGDKIVVNGDLSFADKVSFKMNQIDGTVKAGVYPLISYTGTLTGTLGSITVSGLFGKKIALKDSVNTIWLTIIASRKADKVVWSGTGSTWDLLTSPNWLLNDVSDVFVAGDSVVFNETGKANSTVALVGDLPILDMTVETAANNYSFSGTGIIGGSGGITKNGNGVLTLSNKTNTYTGKTIVNNGTLVIGGLNNAGLASSIGASTSVTPSNIVFNNAKLKYLLGTDTHTDRGFTISGTQDTLEIASATVSHSGVITGTGKLVKTGGGVLYLQNNGNTYSGGTVIKQGTIQLNDPGAVIGSLGSGLVTFEGGTLSLGNTSSYTTCNMNFMVPEGATGTLKTDQRCNFYGTLTGAGTLTINNPGTIDRTIYLGNWSAFTGTVKFTGATARLAGTNGYANAEINLGTGVTMYFSTGTSGGDAVASTVNLGALSGVAGSFLAAENWVIGSKNVNTTFAGIISGNSIRKVGTGELTLSGANTFTGGTTVANGTLVVANATGSATGTGAVTVKSGALLSGRGILTSAVTIENGGTVEPGNTTPGTTLTLTSLTLNATSVYKINTNSTTVLASKVSATGSFTANGQLLLNKVNTEDYQVGQSFTVIVSPSITGTFASISPETPGTDMAWDISTLYTDGKIKVASTKTSGLNGITKEKLDVYPNPCTNNITVVLNRAIGNATITIENMNGQTMHSTTKEEMASETIDVAFLPVGVYIIQIKTDNAVYLSKFYKK